MHTFSEFVKTLKQFGLEGIQKYYSLYPATVKDNNDPKKQGRVKVVCDQLAKGQVLDWAYPVSRNNVVSIPKVDDKVWVFFRNGEVRFPVYIGGWWIEDALPEVAKGDDYPNLHVWITPNGNTILMNDNTGQVYIENAKGAKIELDTDGVVQVNGSGQQAVKGNELQTQVNKLKQQVDVLLNILSTWAPIPNDGGAALKTALTASGLFSLPNSNFGSILSDKVKLD